MTANVSSSPVGPDVDARYKEVIRLYRAGDIEAMCLAAEQLVGQFASHGKAWHMLGLGRLMQGKADAALPALEEAVTLIAEDAEILDHLGCAYFMLGQHDRAATFFSRSVAASPERAESWFNLGRNALAMARAETAVPALQEAVRLAPDMAFAHDALALALHSSGRLEESLRHCRLAVELLPDNAAIRLHQGVVEQATGDYRAAIRSYQEAIERDNQLLPAWCNLAGALHDVGDVAAALRAADHVMRLAPDSAEVLNVAATIYAESGHGELAIRLLQRLTELRPGVAEGWYNLGNALSDPEEKIRALRRAIELRPEFAQAWSNLVFNLNYLPASSASDLLSAATEYGKIVSRQICARNSWPNEPVPEKRLRVGFVSADLTEHPVSFFLEGVLMALDRQKIEPVAYFNGAAEDAWSARLKPHFSAWHSIWKRPDSEVCRLIETDRIDILIDLSGHTAGHRLTVFAARPAPVQVSWLGYVGTTGLTTMDYVLADPHVLPETGGAETVEKVWRLPESYMCFTPPALDLAVGPLPAEKSGYITFGCFNNFAKVNDRVLDTWGRLLKAIPAARLLLRARRLGNPDLRERVLARFTRQGIAAERIELAAYLDRREDALAEYRRIDIALDTFPYCGATTSAEALWMGVPVLTLNGDMFITRIGASMNRNLGLQDWVAGSEDDYVARAVRLAGDRDRLALLRRTLRDRGAASPLGNPTWFANQFALALRGMWREWCGSR